MLCGECIFFDYLGRCHNGNTRRVERPYFAEACKYAEPKQKEQPKTINTMNEEKKTTTKVCKTCGRELPIEQFAANVKSKDGHLGVCKECNFKARSESRKAVGKKTETPSSDPELLRAREAIMAAVAPAMPKQSEIARLLHAASSKVLIAELAGRGWKGTLTHTETAELNMDRKD